MFCCNHGRCGQLVSFGGGCLWIMERWFCICFLLRTFDVGYGSRNGTACGRKDWHKEAAHLAGCQDGQDAERHMWQCLDHCSCQHGASVLGAADGEEIGDPFRRLRSSFSNSVMSVADYWRGSLALMKSERQKELFAQGPCSKPISEEEFVECSDQAWSAVRRLFSMCTDCKKEEGRPFRDAPWCCGS